MHQLSLCLGSFLLAVTLLSGQEAKLKTAGVPPVIRAAIEKRFPHAQVSSWSRETEDGKTTYEASVSDSSGKRDAVFSPDGSLVAIEETMPVSDLPTSVKNAIRVKYPNALLKKAEKITRGAEMQYEVDLAQAARKEVLLNSDGKILKEE